jgi:dTDP-4-dehydrorhamnose reductase
MRKVLITGINGMLGRYIYRQLSTNSAYKIYGTGRSISIHPELKDYFQGDLCDVSFNKKCSEIDYDFVVHCAALVNLNICEMDYSLAEDIHVIASKNLAVNNPNSVFIYISTDSVFDGGAVLNTELDNVKPLNNYSLTKHQGSETVRKSHSKVYDLRLNIYGFNSPMRNSLFEWAYKAMLNNEQLTGYENVTFNPLYAGQIAEVCLNFIQHKPVYGIYNLGCDKTLSKHEFIVKVAELFDFDKSLITKSAANFANAAVNRPYHTALNTSKLKSTFPHLDLDLNSGLKQLKKDLNTN